MLGPLLGVGEKLGLQRGVPLAEYVDSFAYTRFGPAGAVEGDPATAARIFCLALILAGVAGLKLAS